MLETIQQTNLAQLERRHYSGRPAGKGGDLLDRLPDKKLDKLLRSHRVTPILSSETGPRDQVDALVSYYGLLEIGALAGCLPNPLPRSLSERARRHLSRPSVRRYYEHFYPLVLPQLFLERVEGAEDLEHAPSQIRDFMTFLQISDLASGEPVDSFLWFLDDGQSQDAKGRWWSLSDFLQTLSDKKALVAHMTRPEKDWGPLETSLQGFFRFLSFARTLDGFLQSCPSPVLRSAFWHHHAYWFQQLGGQVGGVIAVAIEQYRTWVGHARFKKKRGATARPSERELIRSTNDDMDQSQLALRRLTSGIYRTTLERKVFKDLAHEADAHRREEPAAPAPSPSERKFGWVIEELQRAAAAAADAPTSDVEAARAPAPGPAESKE